MHRLSYKIMLLLTIAATIGGLFTLLPSASASYPNILGYKSLCTFTPAATLYCFLIAGMSCFLRSSLIKDQSGSIMYKIRKRLKSLIPLTIILVIAVAASIWIVVEKQKYIDSGSTATVNIKENQ